MSPYTGSTASTDPSFSHIVTEKMSSEQLSNPFKNVELGPGMWRGAIHKISGVRECSNTMGSWLEACVGGDDFDAGYCRDGHQGPLCANCEEDYYVDSDTTLCEKCDGKTFQASTLTSSKF